MEDLGNFWLSVSRISPRAQSAFSCDMESLCDAPDRSETIRATHRAWLDLLEVCWLPEGGKGLRGKGSWGGRAPSTAISGSGLLLCWCYVRR